jgi:hypothetical protein
MKGIDSDEKVAIPEMLAPEPPKKVCVMIRRLSGIGVQGERVFHEDFPVGFDLDGKFRARVGAALSEVVGPVDPQLAGENDA